VFNALNPTLLEELRAALRVAAADDAIGAIVITGAGRAFCAGQDLHSFQEGEVQDPGGQVSQTLERQYSPVVRLMRSLPKPVIAAVNGVAAGAGMSLALACDLRLMSDGASFTLAFSKIGLIPDAGANFNLPRLVGLARALELAWTSRRVGAEEALRIGLVNQVVPAEALAQETAALASSLARGPRDAIAMTKQAMIAGDERSLDEVLALEAQLQSRLAGSPDFVEGLSAFLEKREARFGRGTAGVALPPTPPAEVPAPASVAAGEERPA
jgi:2-(1,2-epoxy-1,2-dihydrophenyl)acetyl-CoA isomerase